MKKLIIAEKPSVAKNIADATASSRRNGYFEGQNYIITWAFGHLCDSMMQEIMTRRCEAGRLRSFLYSGKVFI